MKMYVYVRPYVRLCRSMPDLVDTMNEYWPTAEKKDLRTYANSEDPDQPALSRSLARIFVVRLHNIGTLSKI